VNAKAHSFPTDLGTCTVTERAIELRGGSHSFTRAVPKRWWLASFALLLGAACAWVALSILAVRWWGSEISCSMLALLPVVVGTWPVLWSGSTLSRSGRIKLRRAHVNGVLAEDPHPGGGLGRFIIVTSYLGNYERVALRVSTGADGGATFRDARRALDRLGWLSVRCARCRQLVLEQQPRCSECGLDRGAA
jgi:hypothetical protein